MKKIFTICALLGAVFAANAATELTGKETLGPIRHEMPRQLKSNLNPGTRADATTLDFGYCRDYYTCVGAGYINANIQAVIEIPETLAKMWTGSKITAVNIGFGVSSVKDVEVYISEELGGEWIYSQPATMTEEEDWNEVTLDTPYEFNGKTIYVGYSVDTKQSNDYPIGVDYTYSTNTLGDLVYDSRSGWNNIGTMFGSNCIRLTVEGDNLPQTLALITGVQTQDFVAVGKPFYLEASILNAGTETISALDVTCLVNGKEPTGYTYDFYPDVIAPGETGYIEILGATCDVLGEDIPVTISINKVNGSANGTGEVSNTAYVTSVEYAFDRNVVVEEYTAMWCGWCPRGIVGMAYMKENYADEGFIGIAVHDRDEMAAPTYASCIGFFAANGLPAAAMDRYYAIDPNTTDLESFFLYEKQFIAPAGVEVTAEYSPEDNTIKATADAQFIFDYTNSDYMLAFVLIENNVGPYLQDNYYAGGKNGTMEGWESKPDPVLTTYQEVARYIDSAFGIEDSLPGNIVKEQKYSYSVELPLDNVTNVANCEVVAMLINGENYEIVNAAQCDISNAGVESIFGAGSVNVSGGKGVINFNGDYKAASVYSLDGKAVGNASGADSVEVAPGVYVVKVTTAEGKVVNSKVLVK